MYEKVSDRSAGKSPSVILSGHVDLWDISLQHLTRESTKWES